MSQPPRSLATITSRTLRCWTGAARGFLIVLAAPIALRFAWAASSEPGTVDRWPPLIVDANTAPVAVFEALPGIGPALAGRIDQARAERSFASLADLDHRVKGIGPAKAAGLRPFLRFDAHR